MKVYIDKKNGSYRVVRYDSRVKDLLLRMRAYYLKKKWDEFNRASKLYQESIFNDEICKLGSTESIAKYEKNESVFRQIFSQKNSQGYHHWWQDIATHEVEYMNPSKSLLDQGERGNRLIENYGAELATEFFDWYIKKYIELKQRVK